jgi:large subunit ribosomal protein L13Ae
VLLSDRFCACMQTVVVDCRGHMLGRLASILAKQILSGHHVVCVRCEDIQLSGGMVRQKAKYERFLRKRSVTNPRRGAVKFRAPSKILWRTVRGMVPHKTARGAASMERLKVFEGVPAPYDKVKRMVIPDALKVLRLQQGHKSCRLGDVATQIGWKHNDVVAELEAKRKVKSAAFYQAKKKAAALRRKAEAEA